MYHIGHDAAGSSDAGTAYSLEPEPTSRNVHLATGPKQAFGLQKLPTTGSLVWKILVLDQQTKDILATVLRVQDLRDVGVTLHVYVDSSQG